MIEKLVDVLGGEKELSGDRITVGISTCGISAGALPTLEALKKAKLGVLVEGVGCAGMCYNEPVVTVKKNGKHSIYGHVTAENVGELIDCIKKGKYCAKLLVGRKLSEIDYYKKQKRVVMENCGKINPLSIKQYAACGGFKGLEKALSMKPLEVVSEVKRANLRGRGGAGFPAGVKWSFLAEKEGKKYLVCNGDEGDPGAFMNRTMIESDPFRLLEGIIIAAYAIGAEEAFIYTREEYPLAIETLTKAIRILEEKGLLGERILGKNTFNLEIKIKKGAGAFVCGEETALMRSIRGKRGYPKPRPPYPAEKGLWNHPTNINNVGTLTNVPVILRDGAKEYKKIGGKKSSGTKILCLAGKINRPGVIEVPFGTSLETIVFDIGGGVPKGTEFKAVQSGGPAGGCISKKIIKTKLDYESLEKVGSIMGSGGLVVLNNEDCMVDVARYFMKFTQEESCGKCTPCREGNMRLLELLEKITGGVGTQRDLDYIKKLSVFVRDNSLCGLGQNAPNPVFSTMEYFMREYTDHIKDKNCVSGVCKSMTTFTITADCVGCGNCARACPVDAITGKLKQKHKIEQEKCIKCGECYRNCAFKAIRRDGIK